MNTTTIEQDVRSIINTYNLTEKRSNRKAKHFRFDFDKNKEQINKIFGEYGITLELYNNPEYKKYSSEYKTYKLTKGNETEFWVNSSDFLIEGRVIYKKALTPTKIGLIGKTFNSSSLRETVYSFLSNKYEPNISNSLMNVYDGFCNGDVKVNVNLVPADVSVAMDDFGETLSAAWLLATQKYKKIKFPDVENFPVVDFFATKSENGKSFDEFSVKSGGGSKNSIANILNKLEENKEFKIIKEKCESDSIDNLSLRVLETITKNSAKYGIIVLHHKFKTDEYKKLLLMMGMSNKNPLPLISEKEYENWVKEQKKNKSDIPEDISYQKLGDTIVIKLNADENVREGMQRIARLMSVKQINIDLNLNSKAEYKPSIVMKEYRDLSFTFAWAGAQAGNRIGYSAKGRTGLVQL